MTTQDRLVSLPRPSALGKHVLVIGGEPWGLVAAADLTREGAIATVLPSEDGCAALDTGSWDLAIVAACRDALADAISVAQQADRASVMSLHAYIDGLHAVVGPLVVPGHTACWNCARLRTLANSRNPRDERDIAQAFRGGPRTKRACMSLTTTVSLLGHLTGAAAIDLLTRKEASRAAGHVITHHLVHAQTTLHGVLPLPDCEVCGGAERMRGVSAPHRDLALATNPKELREALDGIVDERTGIVRELIVGSQDAQHSVEMPITATALLGAYSACAYHDHPMDPEDGSGKGLGVVEAMVGAVGEAIERYSARAASRPSRIVRGKAKELSGTHIDPGSLCLYDESQYMNPGFPFVPVDAETTLDWVKGFWLDTHEEVFVPALPVFYDFQVPKTEEFCQVTSNGLAAGPTLEEAAFRAALELIERDAFTLTWLARRPGAPILLDDSINGRIRDVARKLGSSPRKLELFLLDVGIRVPTVMCVVFGDGHDWPSATVSLSAHLSPRRAIEKAILEHGQGGPYQRRILEEGKRRIPNVPSEVMTLEDHALYYFPEGRARAFDFLRGISPLRASDLEEPPELSTALLTERVRAADLSIAIVDVTSPDLLGTPFRVARALGPRFQQIHFGHALMRLGNPRLWALAPSGPNPDPHPLD